MDEKDNYRPLGLTAARPVILVADQSWDGAGGGAVILRSLIEKYIGDGIVWATPTSVEQDLERGRFGLRSGSMGRTGKFSLLADLFTNSAKMAEEVSDLARRINAGGIWVILHGATIAIAAQLARTGGVPIHATVHDDPIYATALRSRRLALFAPLIARDFSFALRQARSVDVVCPEMGERYERKYGVKSRILRRGLETAPSPSPAYELNRDGLSVGILGNTYSYQQLPLLGQAVESAAKCLGVRGRIVICGQSFGGRLQQDMQGRIDVDVTGHIPEQDCISKLQRCGLLYLSYPFGRINRVLGQTSFPTKLSTYIYASRPLLVHAPEGTTLADLPKDNGFIDAWTTLNPADGEFRLKSMIGAPSFSQSHHVSAESLRARYYDLAVHRATLSAILEGLVGSP
jgi:hypothetical protein